MSLLNTPTDTPTDPSRPASGDAMQRFFDTLTQVFGQLGGRVVIGCADVSGKARGARESLVFEGDIATMAVGPAFTQTLANAASSGKVLSIHDVPGGSAFVTPPADADPRFAVVFFDRPVPASELGAWMALAEGFLAEVRRLAQHERWSKLQGEVALICNDRMRVVAMSPAAAEMFGTVSEGGSVAEVVPGWHLERVEPGEVARGFNETLGMGWTLNGLRHDPAGATLLQLRFRPPSLERLQQQYQTNFLQALRHDVRSPLTALRGLVAVLIDEPLMAADERGQLLELLRVEAERIVNFVEDYLVAMRLRIDPRPQQKRLCDLRGVLAQYFAELNPHASARRIHFEQQLDESWVEADVPLLEAFVRNFIGAVFRMADAGSTVRVELAATSLVISGRGPGLFHQLLDRPWTSLARSTSSGKRTPGAALGLFLVKKIADAHGWPMTLGVNDGVFTATVTWAS